MELGELRGREAVQDQTPFHKVALPLLEDIRLGGHARRGV
jgi:hypothetical protein